MRKDQLSSSTIEQDIIRYLANGDKQAISLAYDHYAHALYGIIRRILPTDDLALEVLQDVFVKIWTKGKQYDASKGRLFTWMANIARNAAIDKTRSAAFKQSQKTGELDVSVYNDKQFSQDSHIQDVGLRKVVDQLDEKYRELIDLVYYKGYTQSDIQKELDMPLGTIKTRLRKAIKSLRAVLDKDQLKNILLIPIVLDLIRRLF